MNLGEIIGLAQLIVALIGFPVLFIQLKRLNASLQSDAQSELYSQSGDVRKLITQYPELRKYIYENEPIGKSDNDYSRARTLAELYANYLEHFVIQAPNLRRKDWKIWGKTLLDIYDGSPIIREAIFEKPQWYSSELHDFLSRRGWPE